MNCGRCTQLEAEGLGVVRCATHAGPTDRRVGETEHQWMVRVMLQEYGAMKGKAPRIPTAIATSPDAELFVLFSNGELWRYYYLPLTVSGAVSANASGRQWERLELPNPPDA